MSDPKKHKKTKKPIVDIQEPGTSAPAATSRPVIVTNRPLLQDPMVVEQTDDAESKPAEGSPLAVLDTGQKAEAQPLEKAAEQSESDSFAEVPPADAELAPEETDTQPVSDPPEADSAAAQAPEPIAAAATAPADLNQADQPDGQPVASPQGGEALSGDTPKQVGAKQAEAEAAAVAKHDAEVQEMVDSKRYVLPINALEKRKSKRFVLLGIALAGILIIVWLDIALDAGIIKLGGLKPLTHFFSN
jgi:hypothetical protein